MKFLTKTSLVVVMLFLSQNVIALRVIPAPDMSKSSKTVVNTNKQLLEQLELSRDKVSDVKLGSVYGELGMFYQAHEFFAAAKVSYSNANELSPFDYRWFYLLAFIQANEGDFDHAIHNYEKVLSISSEYLPAYIRLAEIELNKGNFKKAQELLRKAIKIAPDFAKAYVVKGTIEMQQGREKEAIDSFNKALKLQPKAKQVNYLLSQIYASMGKEEKAKELMKLSSNRPVQMYDALLQQMHLKSVSSAYYAHAAINSFMLDDYKLAEKLINYSIRLDPDGINQKFTLINILISTKRTKEALALAKKMQKEHPKDERVAYSLGVLNEIQNKDEVAVKWYNRTLKINSKNKVARVSLANAFMRLKKYNEALSEFRKSQQIDSNNPYSYYAEGVILSHLKVCDKSISKFLEALKKSPNENFTYLTAFIKTVAMCNPSQKGVKVDALTAARNMYRLAPSLRVTQSLAMIEMTMGNKKDAIDYQAQVIFDGLMQKLPKNVMKEMKADFELYKKGFKVKTAIKPFDIDLNPHKSNIKQVEIVN